MGKFPVATGSGVPPRREDEDLLDVRSQGQSEAAVRQLDGTVCHLRPRHNLDRSGVEEVRLGALDVLEIRRSQALNDTKYQLKRELMPFWRGLFCWFIDRESEDFLESIRFVS